MHRFKRLENTATSNTTLPPRQGDYFATRLTNQLPCYVSWRADPHAYATDAFTLNWNTLCLPPIQSNTSDIDESNGGQCNSCFSCANLASATLVATSTETSNTPTSSPPNYPNSSGRSIEPKGHPPNAFKASLSRLGHFQQCCSAEGFPKSVTQLLSAATRHSTNKTYDSPWGKWSNWCDRGKYIRFQPLSTIS